MICRIGGLLTQKPGSRPPVIGEKRRFSWEQRTSKTGNDWIKIKNEGEDYGELCRVLAVQKTDFTDSHGNVSFNIEFEVCADQSEKPNSFQAAKEAMQNGKPRPHSDALDARQRAIIRQHSQSMAVEVLKLKQSLNELAVEDLTPSKLRQLADYFDQDVLDRT